MTKLAKLGYDSFDSQVLSDACSKYRIFNKSIQEDVDTAKLVE